jgi:hypothetical protein
MTERNYDVRDSNGLGDDCPKFTKWQKWVVSLEENEIASCFELEDKDFSYEA